MYKQGLGKKIGELLFDNSNSIEVYRTEKSLELIITLKDKTKCYYSGSKNMLCITRHNFKVNIGEHINRTPQYILNKWDELKSN